MYCVSRELTEVDKISSKSGRSALSGFKFVVARSRGRAYYCSSKCKGPLCKTFRLDPCIADMNRPKDYLRDHMIDMRDELRSKRGLKRLEMWNFDDVTR